MINVVQTIRNFKELIPDLTVDKALALIECIVEDTNVTLTTYPWNRDIMYTNQVTCTDDSVQLKATHE